MVTKNDCILVFNAMIRGTPISFKERILPLYVEYLTENNFENSDKLINLVVQNPQLIQNAIPELIKFYRNKYNILSLQDKSNFSNNLKTILYYE
jgi:hypothetical protein